MDILLGPTATKGQLISWVKSKNPADLAIDLIDTFWDVAIQHNLNPIMVYCQAMKETGYMKFGGVLDESFKNPCGLKIPAGGGCDDPEAHKRFDTWIDGVTAQCEHLCLYAGAPGFPIDTPIDPRHFDYLFGKCKTVESLSNNWAAGSYGEDIVSMCKEVECYIDSDDLEYLNKLEVNLNNAYKRKVEIIDLLKNNFKINNLNISDLNNKVELLIDFELDELGMCKIVILSDRIIVKTQNAYPAIDIFLIIENKYIVS